MKKLFQRSRAPHLQRIAMIAVALVLAAGPGRALAQRPLGIDVYAGQGSVNWSSVAGSGVSFAWAKATEGNYYIDADFTGNENNGKSAGVYMGAYHFARPDLNSPGTEATYFWNKAGSYVKTDGITLMPMLDFETFNGVIGATTYAAWANAWCNDVVSDASGNGVPVTPVLYTSSCYACEFDTSVAQWNSWIANYNGESAQTGTPWNTCTTCEVFGSGVWNVWQYSSTGTVPGISGAVDEDVFNGNSSSLVSTLAVEGSPNPASTLTSNGHIDVFCIGTSNGDIDHDWQTAANGGWNGMSYLGHNVMSKEIVANNKDNTEQMFAVGANSGHLFTYNQGNWTSQTDLGGNLVDVTVGTNSNGGLELFAIQSDGKIYHNWQSPAGSHTSYSGWNLIGGSGASASIVVNNDLGGNLHVFYIGANQALYHAYQTSTGWTTPASLGGSCNSICVQRWSQSNGHLEVYSSSPSGTVNHIWETSGNGYTSWSSWGSLAGSGATRIACGWNNGTNPEIFFIGSGHTVHNLLFSGGAWPASASNMGNPALHNISVCNDQDGALEVFGVGDNGNLYHDYQVGGPTGSWNGFASLGGSEL